MKLYSNIILSWPQMLHLSQRARIYSGKWNDYYFYKILQINPIIIHTYSPIELLQENIDYYCYNKYQRFKHLEEFGNKVEIITINDNKINSNKFYAYLPRTAVTNDVILIHMDNAISPILL
jgi:hypothetical protein